MLDIIKFIFSSFEVWLGTVVLIMATGVSISQVIAAANKKGDK